MTPGPVTRSIYGMTRYPAATTPTRYQRPTSHFAWLTPIATLAFFVALLFSATFKAQEADGSGLFIEQASAVASALAKVSIPLLATLPIFLFVSMANTRRRTPFFAPAFFAFLALLAWEVGRSATSDSALSLKISVTLTIAALAYLSFALCGNAVGPARARQVIMSAFIVLAVLLVVANGLILAQGQGFNNTNHRLSGTTSHPNFLAVQLAGCLPALLTALLSSRFSLPARAVFAAVLALGLFELISTGSRTGLVVLSVTTLTFFMLRRQGMTKTLATLITLGFLALLIVLFTNSDPSTLLSGGAYDRGGVNTRSEAWAELIDRISAQPFLGSGVIQGASESSFLRGWAIYGLVFPLLSIVIATIGLFSFFKVRQLQLARQEAAYFYSLFIGLLVGSVFEGYLTDALSLPLIMFMMSILVLDQITPLNTKSKNVDKAVTVSGLG